MRSRADNVCLLNDTVVLILGASVFSPREVFVIDFRNEDSLSNDDDRSKHPKEKVMRLCAQKLIRSVIANSTQRFTRYDVAIINSALPAFTAECYLTVCCFFVRFSALAVTSLHVVVLAERRTTNIPGFVPKQSFRLRLPKSKRHNNRTHHFCISGGNAAPSPVPEEVSSPSPLLPQNAHSEAQEAHEVEQRSQLHANQDPEASWFRQKNLVLDPNLIWYTFDKPIAGFSGVI